MQDTILRSQGWPLALSLSLLLAGPLQAQEMRAAPVRVVSAQLQRMAPTINIPGTVLSRDDARLSAELSGRLISVAEVGQRLAAGDTVAQIEATGFELQRQENEGLVARAEARIPFLDSELERLRQLAKQNNAARSQLEQTESDLNVARNDLRVARSRLQLARVQLAKTRITAPFAGLVTERIVQPGEMVAPSQQVVRLVNTERLEVVARAPLRAAGFVEPGAPLRIVGDRHTGDGAVRTLVPFGDARSHMFEIRIDVSPANWAVGEQVRIAVPTAAEQSVLALPRDALVLRAEGAAVFRVAADNTAERIPVTPGIGDGDMIAVSGDLSVGDQIIVRGAERLSAGQQIRIIGGPPGDAGVVGSP